MNIIQVWPDGGVTQFLQELGHEVRVVDKPFPDIEKPMNANLIVFVGGADVSPWLYNKANENSNTASKRDLIEVLWFHKFFRMPKLGICRGGQFLNVMSGGTMLQDYAGHAIGGTHTAYCTLDRQNYEVTSTHHQIMLGGGNTSVLMSAKLDPNVLTYEALFYQGTQSLCFQPHPEYEEPNDANNSTLRALQVCMKNTFGMIL